MDYDSFLELQKNYPRTVGNDYMRPDGLKRCFSSGVMTVAYDDRALFLFERREGFTKLRFRIIDASAVLAPHEEILAAELIYREDQRPDAAVNWLLDNGFVLFKTHRRHTALAITGDLSPEGVEPASAQEAYAVLGEHFCAIEVDLPCRDLFEGAFCVRAENGAIIGVIHLGQRPALAVSHKARGQGVGRRLYRAYAATKVRDGQTPVFHAWISSDNAESLAMFAGLGFTADNVFTDCYVRY